MKPSEIQVKIMCARREMEYWQEILARRSCSDCENRMTHGGCKLANGIVPPQEVQKSGCPEWDWDNIPF